MPSPNKTIHAKSPSTIQAKSPSTIQAKSPSTPNEKARAKNSNSTLRSATPDQKPKSPAPEAKSRTEPSGSKSPIKSPDIIVPEDEADVTNDEDSPEDPFYFTTEPSDEPGKMNTAVLVRPDTADAATDTNDDKSDTDDECDTSVSGHSKRNSRNAYRSESRYARCESAGNPRSDARRSLNHYSCGYLQPSMSFSRFEGYSRQTERYSDVIRPFRYCGYSAKTDYCSRRF